MCKHKTLAFLAILLFSLLISQAYAWDWEFPEGLTVVVPDGMTWHFGDSWVNTTGTPMYITGWRISSWINYTVDGAGTQFIGRSPSNRPNLVYLDGVLKSEGDGWTYTNPLNITGATSSAWVSYGVIVHAAVSSTYLVYGTNITIYAEDSAVLNFKGVSSFITEVTSGLWNGTNCNLTITKAGGRMVFNAQNDSSLQVSTDALRQLQVTVIGAHLSLNRNTNIHSISWTSGNTVTISWGYATISIIDTYFMLGVGLAGIILIVAAPTWWALLFVKHGLDDDSMERLGYSMLLIILGFGFLVIWLWQ